MQGFKSPYDVQCKDYGCIACGSNAILFISKTNFEDPGPACVKPSRKVTLLSRNGCEGSQFNNKTWLYDVSYISPKSSTITEAIGNSREMVFRSRMKVTGDRGQNEQSKSRFSLCQQRHQALQTIYLQPSPSNLRKFKNLNNWLQ